MVRKLGSLSTGTSPRRLVWQNFSAPAQQVHSEAAQEGDAGVFLDTHPAVRDRQRGGQLAFSGHTRRQTAATLQNAGIGRQQQSNGAVLQRFVKHHAVVAPVQLPPAVIIVLVSLLGVHHLQVACAMFVAAEVRIAGAPGSQNLSGRQVHALVGHLFALVDGILQVFIKQLLDTGLEEIEELIDESPYWTTQWVAVKFPHREMAVFNATELLNSLNGVGEVSLLDERLTPSNNVSMRKPTLDGWNSSSSGDADYVTVLKEIGVPEEYIQ